LSLNCQINGKEKDVNFYKMCFSSVTARGSAADGGQLAASGLVASREAASRLWQPWRTW